MKIIPVILSGGSGTRLWPLSRKYYPKQYLPLIGKNSMVQETILRLKGLSHLESPIIVCNIDHRFLLAEQLKQINVHNPIILLEPTGRNSAPAIAAAAIKAMQDKNNKDAVLLVLSTDHVIKDKSSFHDAINSGAKQAQLNKLVTFGIVPTNPNTGYGYIKFDRNINNDAYRVNEFVEKPSLKMAQKYINEGNYLWNSGIFMFKAETLVSEMVIHSKTVLDFVDKSVKNSRKDFDFIRLEESSFESCPSDSIDYAVMEKSNNIVAIPLSFGWDDVGTWSSLYDVSKKDSNGNVLDGDIITKNTSNCYIKSDGHLIATIGVKDLIVVNTPNATLISSKDDSGNVKKIVELLNQKNRHEQNFHSKVHRPWGWYDSIEEGDHFQVKRLHVNPGAKLSLQMHHHRSEHWVVVKGIATATNGKRKLTLKEGESTFIPAKVKHTLENLESTMLELIEVQSGTYLGEDDIVRFEDNYGRL